MAGSKSDVPAKGFHVNSSAWDLERFKNTAKYDKKVEAIFNQAVQEASLIASNLDVNPDKPFQFSDYPQTNARVNKLFSSFSRNYASTINLAVKEEWLNAAQKNDEFVKSILNTSKLTKEQTERYFQRNLEALHAFQQRKIDGTFTLSDRIWKLQGQFKSELEMGLDIGLGEGRSAQQLSQDIRQNLKDPDRLFRRVRDKHGNLQLSKHAKAFHPGQGNYRSSYKNARRLTASETNMAYLTSDHIRAQQLDFVIGFEVVVSNNHPQPDMCDHLAGKYPKDFFFRGWHPLCRCHRRNIQISDEDWSKTQLARLNGDDLSDYNWSNKVDKLPDNFNNWIKDNAERIDRAKSLPYFMRDNTSFKVVGDAIPKRFKMDDIASAVKTVKAPNGSQTFGAFEPFSPVIIRKLTELKTNRDKQRLLQSIVADEIFTTINTGVQNGGTTKVHPLHKRGKNWNDTLGMATNINKSGGDVVFLPEYADKTSADALVKLKEKWVIADFKHSTSTNWNTLAVDLEKGFTQASSIVLKLENADLGQIRNCLEYMIRQNKTLGDLTLINSNGQICLLEKKEILSGRYLKKIRGFL